MLLPWPQTIQRVVVVCGEVLVVRRSLGGIPVLRTGGRHGGLRLTAYNFRGRVARMRVAHSLRDNEQDPGSRERWRPGP
jgi:hypothetical protein